MFTSVSLRILIIAALLGEYSAAAQEQSVRPGINDSFTDPNVQEFAGRFEVESREVYSRRQQIVDACEIVPGMTVADIGAGTGLFTRLFAAETGPDGRVLAVDISPKFLEHIERTCREAGLRNVETVLCTAESTELPPQSVDVAFICDTYHHFEYPLKTMESLYRAMKPGGRVVLIDFRRVEGSSSDWVLDHVRAGQEVFEAEILQAGFQKISEDAEILSENYFVVFRKPEQSSLIYPLISGGGGVVARPQAAQQPRSGAKVVFDVTAGSQQHEINKGLDRAARLLNLYGAAGLQASDIRITVVLHGEATQAVLSDEAWQHRYQLAGNPNLSLIRSLQKSGVDILVCGQALNYKMIEDTEVASGIPIAAAAMTVVINRQQDGYSFIPFH